MLRSIFLKTLYDQRRALAWWSAGLITLGIYLIALYPSIRDNAQQYDQLLSQYPDALIESMVGTFGSYGSPAGYLNSSLFFMVAPLLYLIYAIGLGGGAVAGEEERGTLDLLLAKPIPRWRVALEKFAAMATATSWLGFVLWASLAISVPFVQMEVSVGRLAEVTLSGVLLGVAFGALALALGCLRGDRGLSIGAASGIAAVAYFLNSLAPSVKSLEPYQKLSPFYYYIGADPLASGLKGGHLAVLVGLTVVLLAMGLLAFQRRDLAA